MKSVARRSGRLHVGVTCEGRERVERRVSGEDTARMAVCGTEWTQQRVRRRAIVKAVRPSVSVVLGDISYACMQASPDLAHGARAQSTSRSEENRQNN